MSGSIVKTVKFINGKNALVILLKIRIFFKFNEKALSIDAYNRMLSWTRFHAIVGNQ